jgi:prophage antirepressor-like protein
VERDGEWSAVLADVANALDLDAKEINRRLTPEFVTSARIGVYEAVSTHPISKKPYHKTEKMLLVNEFGLYEAILESRKPEAKAFKLWVFEIIKTIRRDVLKIREWEAFRLMDRERQKESMRKLNESLREPVKVDYIKANAIADKAASTMHGYPKLVKKADMDEGMLRDRQSALEDAVELMAANERFGLGLSISEAIYRKYCAAPKSA